MLFLVRIAQGLVHMGKGLFTLNPYHTDNQLASGGALTPSPVPLLDLKLVYTSFANRLRSVS